MKKFLMAAIVAMLALAPLASLAEEVPTPVGTVGADSNGSNGGYVWADGAETNEDPTGYSDGYIGAEIDDETGVTVYCGEDGGFNDVDEDGNPTREECDPQP